ncbi:MAG TPA: hypothetical protein VE076_03220, partial [Nitrososphaeraceae archaeon]|nr:hypothetical protein [Nitrososphaeraceae archaeon]
MAITLLVDRIYIENYFTSNLIFGVPLLVLSFLFVSLMWAFYVGKMVLFGNKFFDPNAKRISNNITNYKISFRINNKLVLFEKLKNIFNSKYSSTVQDSLRITLAIAITFAVSYWYIFTFIFWAQIRPEVILAQTTGHYLNVPWYLFPMKLGLTGLLGLAFILSYLFKKFQKEIFVFGVIAVIAFFAGIYYDEQRLNKYIMLGMVGFASLLIYEILTRIIITKRKSSLVSTQTPNITILVGNNNRINNNSRRKSIELHKTLVCGLIIGSVITLSSISVLLFIGYHASALERHNFDLALGRRDFPSTSELNLLRFLDTNLADSKLYNVALMADQYDLRHGLTVRKIQGFAGLPQSILVNAPLTLNASTLGGFYKLLNQSNTRYIILPTNITQDQKGMQTRDIVHNVLPFALRNFQIVFQDINFTVLAVPSLLAPPSSSTSTSTSTSDTDIALIHQRRELLPSLLSNASNHDRVLPYDKESFDRIDKSKFVATQNKNATAVLNGSKGQTLWSAPFSKQQNVSYIEGTFRILHENRTKTNRDCGIAWDDGIKKYYARIAKDKLLFSQTNATGSFNLQDQGIHTEEFIWYKIKIFFYGKTFSIYLDDLPKLQMSRPYLLSDYKNSSHISKVGIRCSGNIGEFKHLHIGLVSGGLLGKDISNRGKTDNSTKFDNANSYSHVLTALALSNIGYDTFLDNDSSAFSKKILLLASDPVDKNNVTRYYLEHVKSGGTLIVVNSDDDTDNNNNEVNGTFGRLLGIQNGVNVNTFNNIGNSSTIKGQQKHLYGQDKQNIKVSGMTRDIQFKRDPSVKVLSFYLNNDHRVAAFAVEKDYPQGGRIIFVNAGGYFKAISKDPCHYFGTLSNFPSLVAVKSSRYSEEMHSPAGSITTARYIGDLNITGQSGINSSSISFPDASNSGSYNLYPTNISIFSTKIPYNKNISIINKSQDTDKYLDKPIGKTAIKNLKLSGPYEVVVNSTGFIKLPTHQSYEEYTGIALKPGFNMTVQLSRGASAEFTTVERNHTYRISGSDDNRITKKIQFDRMETD